MKNATTTAPSDLAPSGAKIWNAVTADFDLEAAEVSLLLQACRCADASDALQKVVDREGVLAESSQGIRAHPALVEARAQRALLGRLLKQLGAVGAGRDTPD